MKSLFLIISLVALLSSAFGQYIPIKLTYPDTLQIRAVTENDGNIYVLAKRGINPNYDTHLMKSSDFGDSWTVINSFKFEADPLLYATANDSIHYIINDYSEEHPHFIFKTTDAFSTIDTIPLIGYAGESFYAINKDTLILDGGIINEGNCSFVSHDGAQSWDTIFYENDTTIGKPAYAYGYNRKTTIANDTTWYKLAHNNSTYFTSIIKTQNAGVTWDTLNNILAHYDGTIPSISFFNNRGAVFNYGYPDKVYLSLDGGSTFNVIDSLNNNHAFHPSIVRMLGNDRIDVWGKIFSGAGLKSSIDNGLTWTFYDIIIDNNYIFYHPIYINDSVVFLELSNHSDFIKLVRVDLNSLSVAHQKKKLLFSINPNPTHSFTTLSFENLFSGNIELYDTKGRLLLQENIRALKSYKLNISSLSRGTYYLKLISVSNELVSTKKIIKL